MNYKIKKRWMNVISMMFTAVFVLCVPCIKVQASNATVEDDAPVYIGVEGYELPEDYFRNSPAARTMLMNCFILYACTEGGLEVDISTGSATTAQYLGVKDIKVQQKVWYGWKTVGYSDGYETYNRASSGCSFIYDAEVGETYRISCVHYGYVDEYAEVENVTDPFVFEY